jgi:hypothetical protein
MPDNTNVNNNAAVVVVGRTAPVPPGQQTSDKSIPVVIAVDQSTIPVAEQNKVQSEVALSLLGIPRSEVALGIFADVNTYDVNPTEWSATPEQYSSVSNTDVYAGIAQTMGWGLTHVPQESGALIEGPADNTAILTSKRFFRYQPGRVSSATFGVKTTLINDTGASVQNPAIRKYGIFDKYDGYYWESRNDGTGDNFSVVRRTQSIIYENPVTFGNSAGQQTQDYGRTNPLDPLAPRGSESETNAIALQNPIATPKKFGNLVILRDNLLMTHAAVYDPSLLQDQTQIGITSVSGGNTISISGLGITISNAVYNNSTGLMVITTSSPHGFGEGRYITLTGIGMTCYLDPVNPEYYPYRTYGYNVLTVNSTTSFTVNVGITTVQTFYKCGGMAVGLSTGQYVSYSKGTNVGVITGFTDTKIYSIASVGVNTITGFGTLTLNNLDGSSLNGITNVAGISSHVLITPVPFVQPTSGSLIGATRTKYTTIKPTGMFPYMYKDASNNNEGYIDSSLGVSDTSTLKDQIDAVNNYYNKWVNQNVKKDYWNVYEYRVPRSRFSGDGLDGTTDTLLYSDTVGSYRPGQYVTDANTGEILTHTSIWNIDLTKVTMYKIEFSWYGAVGALFLAYVPVSNGEARWVRVHHLRASNQLKVSSLGNATLPITYLVYGGGNQNRFGYPNSERLASTFSYGSSSEHIIKYGASYYIDGGDRGTVKLFSYSTPSNISVYGSKRTYYVGAGTTQVVLTNATDPTDPYIVAGTSAGLSTSYYVGSRVITSNVLDQNIQVNFVDISNRRLYLNSPLNSTSLSTITIIPNRVTPLIGLKCRDFIQSSTGKNVRNRTQVYPTRLSTGSTGVVRLDLLKSPIFQTTSSTTGTLALSSTANIGQRGNPTLLSVNNSSYLAETTGVYGYFRGYYQNDTTQRPISVLGYLENRGATIGYYFYALNSSTDNIVLTTTNNFLKEENSDPTGAGVSPTTTEFTLAPLSSIKVNPQVRSPIPGTGTVVSSIFAPASGAQYDLSPYFDYNKEYLSFPLTNKVDSLYLCASTQTDYNAGSSAADISASLTWEEQ